MMCWMLLGNKLAMVFFSKPWLQQNPNILFYFSFLISSRFESSFMMLATHHYSLFKHDRRLLYDGLISKKRSIPENIKKEK